MQVIYTLFITVVILMMSYLFAHYPTVAHLRGLKILLQNNNFHIFYQKDLNWGPKISTISILFCLVSSSNFIGSLLPGTKLFLKCAWIFPSSFLSFFLCHPAAYGVPGPGTRSEPQRWPTLHCGNVGVEPESCCYRDTADPIVPQQELHLAHSYLKISIRFKA